MTPIAVVGIDCRFPGAPDKDAFWRLLMDGVVTDTEVPSQRWDIDSTRRPTPTLSLSGKATDHSRRLARTRQGLPSWKLYADLLRNTAVVRPPTRSDHHCGGWS